MIVRMNDGMDYMTASRNVERTTSFNMKARIVEHEYDDGQFTFEVELRDDPKTVSGTDGLDMKLFITEVLRYRHIADIVLDWSDEVP